MNGRLENITPVGWTEEGEDERARNWLFLREVERRAGASVGGIRAWLAEKNCDCGGCKMLAAILGAEGER